MLKDVGSIGQVVSGRHLFLREMAGPLRGSEVLDLGCSFGWFEEHAVGDGASRVVGLDLDKAQVSRAESEIPDAEFQVRDVTGTLSDLGRFDVVCAFDVVEHLPKGSEARFLREVSSVLQPGGRFLLSVPYRSFLSCLLDPAFYFGHRHYSIGGMEELLGSTGFEITGRAFGGGLWWMTSMIWLYIFKWIFRREMPFYDLLEKKRTQEHERHTENPGFRSFATMFIDARPSAGMPVSRT